MIYSPFRRPPLPKAKKELVNEYIPFSTVLLIDENGTRIGVMPRRQAQELADQKELDLFCISPNSQPPVCKIMNFSKFMFQKQKAAKEAKANQTRPDENKEIKITPMTSQHDLETKANQAIKLMEKGWKLKLSVFLKGRMISREDAADAALKKLVELLSPYGTIDVAPTKEGRLYYCYMSPIKKK